MKLLYIYLKLYRYKVYLFNKDISKLDKLFKYKLDNINIILLIKKEKINIIIIKIKFLYYLSLLENKEKVKKYWINLIILYYKFRKSLTTLILLILSKVNI
ncbi:hypothetical protein CJF30_00008752 [Rutstroemia sp. NJR-2017a BBW]|nr:hypothetical protein CJF30_00008752 [Rutstroemia sp. NJR-2017a BBW]